MNFIRRPEYIFKNFSTISKKLHQLRKKTTRGHEVSITSTWTDVTSSMFSFTSIDFHPASLSRNNSIMPETNNSELFQLFWVWHCLNPIKLDYLLRILHHNLIELHCIYAFIKF